MDRRMGDPGPFAPEGDRRRGRGVAARTGRARPKAEAH